MFQNSLCPNIDLRQREGKFQVTVTGIASTSLRESILNLIFRDKNRLSRPNGSQTLRSVEPLRIGPAPIAFTTKAAKVLLMGILAASLTMPAVRPALAQGDTQGMIPLSLPKTKTATPAPSD